MAGAHRTGSAVKKSNRRKAGAHRIKPPRQPYAWLGAGAIALGIGVAIASGAPAAHAEDGDSSETSSASTSSGDSGAPQPSNSKPSESDQDAGGNDDEVAGAEDDPDDVRGGDAGITDDDEDSESEATTGLIDEDVVDSGEAPDRDFYSGGQPEPETADAGESSSESADDEPLSDGELDSAHVIDDVADAAELTHVVDGSAADVGAESVLIAAEQGAEVPAVPTPASAVGSVTSDPLGAESPTAPGADAVGLLVVAASSRRETDETDSASVDATPAQAEAEAAREDADARFNKSAGWIPVVGTVYNGVSLLQDLAEFTNAVLAGDVAEMGDEIGDMAIDVIGMIPVVGAPLAATIHWAVRSATPNNQAPIAGDDNVSFTGFDPLTGKVTGLVNVVDPDGDQLVYVLGSGPGSDVGTVVVNVTTGAFTFTPTAQARFTAWTTPGDAQATFTINVSDGQFTTPITVAAAIAPSAAFSVAVLASTDQQDLGNQGLAIAPDGRIYSTTYQSVDAGTVVVLNPDGSYAATVEIASVIPAAVSTAYDVVVGPDGRVYISSEIADTADDIAAEGGSGAIVVIDPATGYAASLFAQTAEPASALAVDQAGRVYVANWNNDDIAVFNADGSLSHVISSELLSDDEGSGVAGMALGADGRLYLTKPSHGVVKVINADGSLAKTLDLGGAPWSVAFDANGSAYVTDAANGAVDVLDSAGNLIRTITLPPGASPTDLSIGGDGTVYVAYTGTDGAAVAVISAAAATDPDPTAWGDVIPGTGVTGGLVVVEGVVYQTVLATNPATGELTTTLAVIAADGTTTVAHVDGLAKGPAVVGPHGVAYQTISGHDSATGSPLTGVLIVSPTDGTSFTGLLPGSAVGHVLVGADGNAYQVISRQNDDFTYSTTLLAITSAGAASHDVAGAAALGAPGNTAAVMGIDGTVYLTTIDVDTATSAITTRVAVLSSTGMTIHTLAGYAAAPVSVAADGTVRQALAIDAGTDASSFEATVAVLTDAGFVTLPDTIAGIPVGGLQIAADGSVYQAIAVFDAATETTTTTVAEVTDTGLVVILEGLPGTAVGSSGDVLPVVVGSDGTVYQTTSGGPDPDTGVVTTYVSAKTPGGDVVTEEIPGLPVGSVVIGPDGTAYQTTYDAVTGTTPVAVITPGDTTVYRFDGQPGDPEIGDRAYGVAVIGTDGRAYQTIVVTDPVTGEYSTMVAVLSSADVKAPVFKGLPSGPVVVGADGAVYQSVSRFDVATQSTFTTVISVDASGMTPVGAPILGQAVGSLVVGPDGLLYQAVLTEGAGGQPVTAVQVIDPAAGGALRASSVIAAAAQSGPTVTATIAVGDGPAAVVFSPNGAFVYVSNSGSNSVSVINAATRAVIATIPVGSNPSGVVFSPNGNYAYAVNSGSNSVSVINTTTRTVVATIPVGSAPLGAAVSPNGRYLYVANEGSGTVSVIDTTTNAVVRSVSVGSAPWGVVANPNGKYVYVTNAGSDTVSVINTATNTVTSTIPVGAAPWGIAISPDGSRVYDADINTVSVINATTGSFVATIPVGNFAVGVVVSPNGRYVYVTNRDDNTVSVIDTTTSTVAATVAVSGGPFGVAISPDGKQVYVTGYYGDTVTVLATSGGAAVTKPVTKPVPAPVKQPKPVKKSEVNWSSEAVRAITFALTQWDDLLENYDDWGDAFKSTPQVGKMVKEVAIPAISVLQNFWEGGTDLAAGKRPFTSTLKLLAGVAETIWKVPLPPFPHILAVKGIAFTVSTATQAVVLLLNVTYPDL